MSNLPYPFCPTDEAPFDTVALGNGEYVWVVLAGVYRGYALAGEKYAKIAIDLYCDLHPHLTRGECAEEVGRWAKDLIIGE